MKNGPDFKNREENRETFGKISRQGERTIFGTREDLRDVLNFVKNMGSLVENKGMEVTGQSYQDAVEETEWILADYDIGNVPSLETAHKIDSVLRSFRIEYLLSMIENK